VDLWVILAALAVVAVVLAAIFFLGRRSKDRRVQRKRDEANELRVEADEKAVRARQREALAEEQAERARQEREEAEEQARRADEIDPDNDR
jgi:flagellar biosynthesis/type III secretory pathway M-ring protein FliF/YscJ